MLPWIGIALLSASWLPGLGYYHPVDWPAWIALVAGGTALLACTPLPVRGLGRTSRAPAAALAALLSLPALWVAPWPYRASFWGIVVGAALQTWPLAVVATERLVAWLLGRKPRSTLESAQESLPRWLTGTLARMSAAVLIGGCVLVAQGVALLGYEVVTSRSHELPGWLAKVLGAVAGALGMEVGVDGSNLPLFSYFHRPSLLGATWELLLDPATWCFLVGGSVLVAWRGTRGRPSAPIPQSLAPDPRFRRLIRALAWFVVPVLLWLPVRAGILLTIYLHDLVWTDLGPDWIEAPVLSMRLFWSTPLHLLLLAGPVLLAWRLGMPKVESGERKAESIEGTSRVRRHFPLSTYRFRLSAGLLTLAGVGCFCVGVFWDPVGQPKQGRILIEENRWLGDSIWDRTRPDKRWERTQIDRKYDTEWYGELAGYNYSCITDYARHFFAKIDAAPQPPKPGSTEMDTVWPLTDALLADYDVLMLKIPGRPFAEDEIDAVERFVRNGGGLLMIGDHTNVYGHATYLNQVARRFGFRYRYDFLLGIDKPWEDRYEPPLVPHPIVQRLPRREPWMEFATSNSIDPGTSDGRAVMRAAGLKSLPPDYHAFNLESTPDDRPQMRYGAFVQLWAMRFGRGRVAAFTDSTSFSNFCVFEPGKKEIWMGMLQWLNHRSPWIDPRYPLAIVGLVLLALGIRAARKWAGGGLVLVGCGTLGWVLAVWGVRWAHESAMPPMQPLKTTGPPVEVVMDQTVCSKPLPIDGTVDVRADSFGIFERWVLRLGCFTARLAAPEEFRGPMLVFLHPDLPVSEEFCKRVADYVDAGGKILVVEAPNAKRGISDQDIDEAIRGRSMTAFQRDREKLAAKTEPHANTLLRRFGVSIDYSSELSGPLASTKGWPAVPVTGAYAVRGGDPSAKVVGQDERTRAKENAPSATVPLPWPAKIFATINGQPVGVTLPKGTHGGSVTVVGFGSRFKDANMGGTDHVEPDKLKPDEARTLLDVYQWHFQLFPAIINGTL